MYRAVMTGLVIVPVLLFAGSNADKSRECVILLHGLARTERSMLKLEHHLEEHGYSVVNTGYPSREKKIQSLSEETIRSAIAACEKRNPAKIHFVTHSMGAILVRYYLDRNDLPRPGRVVMLSPPNKGSETVDTLKHIGLFQWLNGPAGQQLGTEPESLPNRLSPPDYEVGIITGDRTINPILSLIIPGEDDGKVSVNNAKLTGMKDFLVVHKTHTFIMYDTDVINQVIHFIETGYFQR